MQFPVRGAITQADVFQLNNAPIAGGSVVCTAGQWNKLGEKIILAGLYVSLGFGSSNAQSDATGRVYSKLCITGAIERTGRLRISIFTPQDRNMVTLGEWHTSALNQNPTDRSKQLPFPEMPQAIGKDYKFVFEFKPDVTGTITLADSVIVIDTTEQLLN
jgi:hypothetical protein